MTELDSKSLWYNIIARIACYRNRIFSNFLFAIPHDDEHYRPMTQTAAHTNLHSLASSLEEFTRSLTGAKSILMIRAYRSDLQQFFTWLTETDYTVTSVVRIERRYFEDYFARLANKGQTGTTRARKLISRQVFFACLVEKGILPHSPAEKIKRPRREQKTKHYLRPDEYSRVLAEAALWSLHGFGQGKRRL